MTTCLSSEGVASLDRHWESHRDIQNMCIRDEPSSEAISAAGFLSNLADDRFSGLGIEQCAVLTSRPASSITKRTSWHSLPQLSAVWQPLVSLSLLQSAQSPQL